MKQKFKLDFSCPNSARFSGGCGGGSSLGSATKGTFDGGSNARTTAIRAHAVAAAPEAALAAVSQPSQVDINPHSVDGSMSLPRGLAP